ncbi:MAG: beta-N-acetylhexosaminidase [Oscillospiraceae bacterium]|nr:beta-N-acetylhexosaminidase [Oscillospiraceae bacterium]
MNLYLSPSDPSLEEGLMLLSDDLGITVSNFGDSVCVSYEKTGEMKLCVSCEGYKAKITYYEKAHFYRGIGLLLEHLSYGEKSFEITEHPRFTLNGAMYDVAQSNAVPDLPAVKMLLRREAIMGLNMFMLYCEDNYEVEGYPYFGYMRGRYSGAEIKELDDYAYALGIELIPCIQTLAHLRDALRWWFTYHGMRMDKDTLLVGEEKVYDFIDAMIKAASQNVRSKRIHIGMDEAENLGEGQYLKLHGYRRRFDIMLEHLDRVKAICHKYGLKPMIWSDMFFSSATKSGGYYDKDVVIPQEVLDAYPKDVQLVYWDYYRDDKDFYRTYIKRHYEFGTKPVFAGAVHTWYSIAPRVIPSISYTDAALQVCVEENIDEVFCTIWGDDNTEAHIYSTLQGLQLYAEISFNGPYNAEAFSKRFEFCTGIKYDQLLDLGNLDALPEHNTNGQGYAVYSKTFMWNDVLLGFNDRFFENDCEKYEKHFRDCAERYEKYETQNGEYNSMFTYYKLVARALEYKASIGMRLIEAYKSGSKENLQKLLPRLYELKKRMCELKDFHRSDWYTINKPMGFEVFDLRYGTVIARVETAISRVTKYINGEITGIDELSTPRLEPNVFTNGYGYLFSASRSSFVN